MTVKELIAHLQTFDETLPVAYQLHSEHKVMTPDDIGVRQLQPARPDGWIHDRWSGPPEVSVISYLVFPGN